MPEPQIRWRAFKTFRTLNPPGLVMKRFHAILLAGLFFASTLVASAQGLVPVYDSFGPADSFNQHAVLPLQSPLVRAGFAFTPKISGKLDSVTLPLSSISGPNFAQIGI